MREFTQSNVSPGNCWQTAVACILDVEPNSLPSQLVYDTHPSLPELDGWGSYTNVLNGYLVKHFGLMYSEIQDFQFSALGTLRDDIITRGYHMLVGPTIRTPDSGVQHVVVALAGEMVWDPHPSRLGLTAIDRWAILAPVPQRILDHRREQAEKNEVLRRIYGCLCPEHAA